MKFNTRLLGGLLAVAGTTNAAITLDLNSTDSIKEAASTIAYGLVKYYTGNETGGIPGTLPSPYFWWEAGAMFGTLINYWFYTGDTTYNDLVTQAMLWQVGPDQDYMPPNQTKDEGNDDQGFWGMAAMSAAELNYPNPPADQPQWLALAQAVFNDQASRWDTSTCGGGLRWQIFTFNSGYDYKNAISNGCFFNLGARLGKYTGNQTYLDWAEKVFDWVSAIGLMDSTYHFYDGTDDTENCTSIDHIQWTYNAGVYLLGAATMWNVTTGAQQEKWYNVVQGIMNGSSVFFSTNPENVMMEVACESNAMCDTDQQSFKAYLARFMASSIKVAPFVESWVMPRLQASALAAAMTCTAGFDGNQCGLEWTKEANDGLLGVGEQMAVLEVVQGNLISTVAGPVTNSTGGTSKGNAAAGGSTSSSPITVTAVTMADKAGAGILTTIVLVGMFSGAWWMAASK